MGIPMILSNFYEQKTVERGIVTKLVNTFIG